MKIIVTNLNRTATEDDLKHLFGQYGQVHSVTVVRSKSDGLSVGTAVVTMACSKDGAHALSLLKGSTFMDEYMMLYEMYTPPGASITAAAGYGESAQADSLR